MPVFIINLSKKNQNTGGGYGERGLGTRWNIYGRLIEPKQIFTQTWTLYTGQIFTTEIF